MRRPIIFLTLAIFITMVLICRTLEASGVIQDGKKVKFDYTLRVDKEEIDTSIGKQPLEYIQGDGTIIKGLASQLEGLRAGDSKKITVKPKDAYGEIDPNAIVEVPKSYFPDNFNPQIGSVIPMPDRNGRPIPAVVKEIKEDSIILDFNHPLAGKTLEFDVKIISVE